jgi:hypothetical protein
VYIYRLLSMVYTVVDGSMMIAAALIFGGRNSTTGCEFCDEIHGLWVILVMSLVSPLSECGTHDWKRDLNERGILLANVAGNIWT